MRSLTDYIRGMNVNKVAVITSLYPPFPEGVQQLWGGTEVDLEYLVKHLRQFRIAASVISFHYIKPLEDDDESVERIGFYYPYLLGESYRSTVSFAYKELFRPGIFLKLLNLLRKEKPDIVLIGKTYQFSLATYLACILLGIAYVVRYDWLCPTYPKDEPCSFSDRFRCADCVEKTSGMRIPMIAKIAASFYFVPLFQLKRILWNRSQKVLVTSDFYKTFVESFGVKSDKIEIIPPKSELKADIGVVKELERRYKSDGKLILLYVGRLEPEKGVELLLDASENLKEEKIKLLIAGTGRLVQLVKDAIKKNGRIVYLGLVPHGDLGSYYAIADLVVIPSVVPESGALVVEEAISMEKPVIGFKQGATKQVLGSYGKGILVDEINAIALSTAIKGFLKGREI